MRQNRERILCADADAGMQVETEGAWGLREKERKVREGERGLWKGVVERRSSPRE